MRTKQEAYFSTISPLLEARQVEAPKRKLAKEEKPLEYYLPGSKSSKKLLMHKQETLFKGAKRKQAAAVLLALRELGAMMVPEHGKQLLYLATNRCFGLWLRNESHQQHTQLDGKKIVVNVIAKAEIEDIVKILK